MDEAFKQLPNETQLKYLKSGLQKVYIIFFIALGIGTLGSSILFIINWNNLNDLNTLWLCLSPILIFGGITLVYLLGVVLPVKSRIKELERIIAQEKELENADDKEQSIAKIETTNQPTE